MTTRASTFHTLDALRGIAALCIGLRHGKGYAPAFGEASTYLAVDMFFCLSGFVLAHNYDERLRSGMPASVFFLRRLIRLYPLYAFGTILGAIAMLMVLANHVTIEAAVATPRAILTALIGSLLLLPASIYLPSEARNPFPLDFPTWSIFCELVVNFCYAYFARKLSNRVLALTSFASLIFAILIVVKAGSLDIGTDASLFIGALIRTFLSFPLGILLYRYRLNGAKRASIPAAGVFVLFLLALTVHIPGISLGISDLIIVCICFPLLILQAAGSEPRRRVTQTIYASLGSLSYAFYVLHIPLLYIIDSLRKLAHLPMPQRPTSYLAYIVIILLCALLHHCYDLPVRAKLSTRLKARIA